MGQLSVRFALPLRDFELELALELEGVVALVGPSGAGKSTLLAVIAGLARPRSGRVSLDGEVWFDAATRTNLPPDRRRAGLVFQEYALFPHMTVRRNVEYGAPADVSELLSRLRIAHLADARPDQLSGGERQRVALARALAREPGVLLLDEPLAALDAVTRVNVRDELRELLPALGLPTLIVTHDYDDAVALADEVGVIVTGRLRQLGTPAELIAGPADAYVASFTGANLVPGRVVGRCGGLTEVALPTGATVYSTDEAAGEVHVAVHPWEVALAPPGGGDPRGGGDQPANAIAETVVSLSASRGAVHIRLRTLTAEVAAPQAQRLALTPGSAVLACFSPAAVRLIPRAR